ncbi:hypothetical protein NDU88_008031 [Pleurodeles waltl]|uniref:Uncharacterized protein n=1 Tax=Pleurodeles waltl TaxID=8319 RepID=A0AAV7VUA1_PLEWA|nr:hypothetical protein NDU88_008031 [Pleurodeles waltl]
MQTGINQEEEAAGEEGSENAYEEDERDARGDREANVKQEVEENTCEMKGDVDQACEGGAGGEHDMHRKQGEEVDAFVDAGDMAKSTRRTPEEPGTLTSYAASKSRT